MPVTNRGLLRAIALAVSVLSLAENVRADVGRALDQSGLAWTIGGLDEFLAEDESPDFVGGSALKFTRSGIDGTVWIETTVSGPFSVRFWWDSIHGVRSWPERFEFLVNEVSQIEEWSKYGAPYFLQYTGSGPYTLRWQYTDETDPGTGLENAVWLDDLAVSRAPVIDSHPFPKAIAANSDHSLSVSSFTDSPQSYQWLKDGDPILGETNPTLELIDVSVSDSGNYSVDVTNSHGTRRSKNANLIVFESTYGEASDQPEWPWTFSRSGIWAPTHEVHHDGEDAIVYVPSEGDHTPTIRTTVNGIGRVSFWWKFTESPYHYEMLNFYIDGKRVQQHLATTDWVKVSYDILEPGPHELTWVVDAIQLEEVDFREPDPLDFPLEYGAWIDELEFDPDPIITEQPADQVVIEGERISFSVNVTSNEALLYQWRKYGIDIPGANGPTFIIASAGLDDIGVYDVVITEGTETLVSSFATARVISGIDEVLDQPGLVWTYNNDSSSSAGWFPQIETSYEGGSALELALNVSNLDSSVSTIVQGPVTITYWRKTQLFPNVSTYEIPNYTYSTDWTKISISYPNAGPQELKLEYTGTKFISNPPQIFLEGLPPDLFLGYEWIDKVELDYRPIITSEPLHASVRRGESHTFEIETASALPVTYQWLHDGVVLPGETASSLQLSNLSDDDAGNYSVRVTNEIGEVQSRSVMLGLYDDLLEAAEIPDLDWTISNPKGWFAQGDITRDGIDALMTIGDSQNANDTFLEATIQGPFELSYWERTEGGINLDHAHDPYPAYGIAKEGSLWKLKARMENDTESYRVRIGGGAEDGALQFIDQFHLSLRPVFKTHPQSTFINQGDSIRLSSAAASSLPLSYQWLKNGDPIPGATSSTYDLENAQESDTAGYTVLATNSDGATESEVAFIDVSPSYQSVGDAFESSSLTWTRSSEGSWLVQNENSFDGSLALEVHSGDNSGNSWFETTIEGPSTIQFFYMNENDIEIYVDGIRRDRLRVSSEWKPFSISIDQSGPHTIRWVLDDYYESTKFWFDGMIVSNEPIITEHPQSSVVEAGDPLELSVRAASGSPISYQWRKNGIDLPGATESTLKINAMTELDYGNYDVVLSNDSGSATSLSASAISSDTVNQAIEANGLEWELSGSGSIYPQKSITRDHIDALTLSRNGPISYFEIPLTLSTSFEGPANLEYWIQENDTTSGLVRPIIDDIVFSQFHEPTFSISETYGDWNKIVIPVTTNGIHQLDLQFIRYEGNSSEKRMTLDNLRINKAPVITNSLPKLSVIHPEEPFTLEVSAISNSEISYQWLKNGFAIEGATDSALTIENPVEFDSGDYEVIVSNDYGELISTTAQLVFNETLQFALDSPNLKFSLSGNGALSTEKRASYNDEEGLKITVEPGEFVFLEASVDFPKSAAFWWRAEPRNCDNSQAEFRQIQGNRSFVYASSEWKFLEVDTVNKQSSSILWEFSAGEDCSAIFYLDKVSIETSELIANQPTRLNSRLGEHFEISFDWWDTSGLSFQWFKDGEAISGATEQNYHLDSFQSSDAGVYALLYSDDFGTRISDPIHVSTINDAISKALESEASEWTVGKQGDWRITEDGSRNGGDALWLISNSESDRPWIETIVQGPATVEFWWRTGGPSYFDDCNEFHFFINGTLSRQIRSDESWEKEAVTITQEGLHTLRWGIPKAWCPKTFSAMLDSVSIKQGLILYSHPESKTIPEGESATLSVESSSSNASYQWRRDGVEIGGANQRSYQAKLPGSYDVVVSDGIYSQTSEPAILSWTQSIGHLLEQPDLSWEMSDGSEWYASPDATFDGEDALISPDYPIPAGRSWLRTEIEGPVNVSFSYYVTNAFWAHIHVHFFIDGKRFDLKATGDPWDTFHYTIDEDGPHTLLWEVTGRNSTYNEFGPRLYLDKMVVNSYPHFTTQPESNLYFDSESISLAARTISSSQLGEVTYQWHKDGFAIPGATASVYSIPKANPSDTGDYFVTASNSEGYTQSDIARVEILESLGNLIGHSGLPYRIKDPIYNSAGQLNLPIEGPATLEFEWQGIYNHEGGALTLEANGEAILRSETESGWKKERIYLENVINHARWISLGYIRNISVNNLPFIEPLPSNLYEFAGATATLSSITTSSLPVTYQWFKDENPIEGAVDSILKIENLAIEDAGSYWLVTTNVHGASVSNATSLTVYERPGIIIDPTKLEFSFNGNGSWSAPNRLNSSLCGPALNWGQESSVSTIIEGPATVQFDALFEDQNLIHRFEFRVDGDLVFSHNSDSFWNRRSIVHTVSEPGEHELVWKVIADPSETAGSVFACIENLKIVTDLSSIYTEWVQVLFPDGSASATTDMQADPDGDTKSNILEYLLGTDPLTADGPISIEVIERGGIKYWESALKLTAWVSGIDFTFESSDDLSSWEPVESEYEFTENEDSVELLLRSESRNQLDTAKFMRIRLRYVPTVL